MENTEYYNKFLDMLDESYFKGADTEDNEEQDISSPADGSGYSGRIILMTDANVFSFYGRVYKDIPNLNASPYKRFSSIADSLTASRLAPFIRNEVYSLKVVLDSLGFIMDYHLSLITTDEYVFSKEVIANGYTYTEDELLSGRAFQDIFYNNGKFDLSKVNKKVIYGLTIDFTANRVSLDTFMRNMYTLWKKFLTLSSFRIFNNVIQFWCGNVKYMYRSSQASSFGYYRQDIVAFYDAIYGTQEYFRMSPEEDNEFRMKYPKSYGNCSTLTKYLLYVDKNNTKINEDYDIEIAGYSRYRGIEIIFDFNPKSKYANEKEVFMSAVKEIFVERIRLIQDTENKVPQKLINLYALTCPQFCDGKNNPETIDEIQGTPVKLYYVDDNLQTYPVGRQKKPQKLDYYVHNEVLPGWAWIKHHVKQY